MRCITQRQRGGNVHWTVPRPVNSLFTGRSKLIDRILRALRDDDPDTTTQKRLVITGIGGIGKSEVCLKVADQMREDCWGVFWVDVGSQSTAKNGFLAIAKALGSSAESVEESLHALANTKKRWLLLLDSADDPKFNFARCIPSSTQGAVLITSRIPQCARYSTLPAEALEGLDVEHSTQLFLKAAQVPEELWPSWNTRVGCVLALSQGQSETWQAYERQLQPHVQSFLSPSVEAAFSFGTLGTVLPILLKCGWTLNTMREDGRLEDLLRGIYRVLQIAPSDPSKEHIPIWDLAARNLGYMGQDREAVTLLEHIVKVRDTTLKETHSDRLASQHALASAYRANGQTKEAVALLEYVVKVRDITLKETHPDRLASQHALAGAYQANGQTKEAVTLLEHVAKVKETTLQETHPSLLASQHALAIAYDANRQMKEAVALLEHVVKVWNTTLKETHPDRLASQHALSGAYQANGQIKEAVALLEHVVKAKQAIMAENHPSRLVSERTLAHLRSLSQSSSYSRYSTIYV